jgi:hypothetical protein
MIDAPGFRKLTTALYPEGDAYLSSDVVFGVRKSLVVVSHGAYTFSHHTRFFALVEADLFVFSMQKLEEIDNETEARKRGFPKGTKFKLLNYDFTLLREAEWVAARAKGVTETASSSA